MVNKYFFYIILIVLITLLFKIREDFSQANIVEEISPIEDIILSNIPIVNIQSLKKGETYELLDLPYCNEKFFASYSSNTNNILNDGSKIYQDMLKPYDQKAEIANKRQGLTQISWKKSYFSYNEKLVPLELQFTHVEPGTGKVTKVIFPLSFTPNKKSEGFANTINSMSNKNIEDKTISSFEELAELTSLIKSTKDVPEKIPGQVNIGHLLSFDLCQPTKLILDQRKFFFAQTVKNELLLIAKPKLFNRDIGLKIMTNLDDPDVDLVLPDIDLVLPETI
jgi:hypothetical protein